ncbi:DUF1684 domain-containing protein [Herbiconiux sp. 11R-BC]|uniref:DUF1684 domain-containing protein n=1 Tax=Herbiconiux sp. 11R-BC TaxID=3111637 RepID=UPI003C11DE48
MSTVSPTASATARHDIDRAAFARDWEEWHRRHEEARASEHGFLAVTSLNWLGTIPRRFDDAPGSWSSDDAGPVVELAEGESLERDGETLTGRVEFGPLAERTGLSLGHDDAVIELARRGGHDILRPRHPDHPLRTAYTGTPVYPPNPRWLADGTFVPFSTPREVTVGSVAEGIEHVYEAPGEIVFALRGEEFRVTVFNGFTPGSLLLLFTDATSGLTTYAANRSLAVDAPDADSRVLLDFNRAVNLPCAYTDYATCPLPPAGNRLPIGIEAGEKTPLERG